MGSWSLVICSMRVSAPSSRPYTIRASPRATPRMICKPRDACWVSLPQPSPNPLPPGHTFRLRLLGWQKLSHIACQCPRAESLGEEKPYLSQFWCFSAAHASSMVQIATYHIPPPPIPLPPSCHSYNCARIQRRLFHAIQRKAQ